MAERNASSRPPAARALLLSRAPAPARGDAAALHRALREDARELLSALRLRVSEARDDIPEQARRAASEGAPLLLVFDDVPAVPPAGVESAIELLEDEDCVIGPCADGSLWLLGLSPEISPELGERLCRAASGENALRETVALLASADVPAVALPPWFRMATEADLEVASSMLKLAGLTEDGGEEFLADRLRAWLDGRAP